MNTLKKLVMALTLTGATLAVGAPAWAYGVEGAKHFSQPVTAAQCAPATAPAEKAPAKANRKPRMDRSVPTVRSAERSQPK